MLVAKMLEIIMKMMKKSRTLIVYSRDRLNVVVIVAVHRNSHNRWDDE